MDHRVKFNPGNHWQTLTQLHGSVWYSVLPFCIANVANLYAAAFAKTHILSKREEQDELGISLDDFQSTISIVISFLSVTRLSIAVDAYLRQRAAVQTMIRACRSLIFHSVAFTRHDKSETAKHWRLDIARESMALLRLLLTALQYEATGVESRTSAALTNDEKMVMNEYAEGDNERSTYVITMFLQSTIASHPEHLQEKLSDYCLVKLYDFVEEYIKAYDGCFALLDTGLPFPIIQMTRTLVFLFLFTLPWVMYDGVGSDLDFYPTLAYCFFVTYAFMGLELVCIEMDDPFGNDANDLNVASLVEKVFKDITMCIEDVDGDENANLLKKYVTIVDELEKSEESRTFDALSKHLSVRLKTLSGGERSNLLKKANSKNLSSIDNTTTSSSGGSSLQYEYSGYQR